MKKFFGRNRMVAVAVMASALLCIAPSCSDDNQAGPLPEEEEKPENGSDASVLYRSLEVKEVMPSDAQTVTLTQTFAYDDEGRLTGYESVQSYKAVEEFNLSNTTQITYRENEVQVADGLGNVSVYTLNGEGYAVQCIRREGAGDERKYLFSYHASDVNRLAKVEEYLPDGTLYATLTLIPEGDGMRIDQQIDASVQTYRADVTGDVSNAPGIPQPFLAGLHPMSMHTAALYGRLLGEPLPMMITRVVPDGGEESVAFTYGTDEEGWPTSCRMVTGGNGWSGERNITYSYVKLVL